MLGFLGRAGAGFLGRAGAAAFKAAGPKQKSILGGGMFGWRGLGDAAAVVGTVATGNWEIGAAWFGASRGMGYLANKIGGRLAPRSSFSVARNLPSTPKGPKSGKPSTPGRSRRGPPLTGDFGTDFGRQTFGAMRDLGAPVTAATEYGSSFKRAFKQTGQLLRGNKGVDVFGRTDEVASFGRLRRGAAMTGTASGFEARVMGAGVAAMGQQAGRSAAWVWDKKVPILNVGAIGFTAVTLMGMQGYNGNPLAMHTYSSGGQRGQNPLFLQNQMRAMVEYNEYENSPQAGMGAPLSFSRSGYDGPFPITPSLQKAAGYSPAALGATGDLTFALHNLRRS